MHDNKKLKIIYLKSSLRAKSYYTFKYINHITIFFT